jgi:hypothetical protein
MYCSFEHPLLYINCAEEISPFLSVAVTIDQSAAKGFFPDIDLCWAIYYLNFARVGGFHMQGT